MKKFIHTYDNGFTVEGSAERNSDGGILVMGYWTQTPESPVRAPSMGWAVPSSAVAARLLHAIADGVVFLEPQIKTDIHGKRYVSARNAPLMSRRINADLLRLGY